jgi:hypothetical protein
MKTEGSNTSQKIEQIRNNLKDFSKVRNDTNKLDRRMKNLRARLVKENTQISIDQLRDRKQIILELVHKSDIIQGKIVIYLDDVSIEHFTFLVIPKSHILIV